MNMYRAPFWLPGAHLQTIVPAHWAPRANIAYRRERWDTPDGDFIDADWLADPRSLTDENAPILVVFHGLEGSSNSRYARGLMAQAQAQGWRGVVPHFRGCSGSLNRAPRFYHSGDSAEADWILHRLRARFPRASLYAAGISLGGNVLLKWLGEQGAAAQSLVTRAAAISAPVDLTASAIALRSGFNRVYARDFLCSLKPKSLAKLEHYPDLFDRTALLNSRNLTEFDDHVTAPVHGFRNAEDYYIRSSSKSLLPRIAVPTLLLNARNDPFLPPESLPRQENVSSSVTLDYPDEGGHVGFWHRARPGAEWMPERVMQFFMSFPPLQGEG